MSFFKKDKNKQELETKKSSKNNPYLNAREEWLERYGDYIKQARNWRFFSVFALCLCAFLLSINFIQASKSSVIPYIIEVDKLGRTQVVGRADKMSTAPEHMIQSVLASCISDWRTVTADIELQKRMIAKLSYFFMGSAKGVLKEWYSANSPYSIAKNGKLVHVEVNSLPLPISEDSYRLEWTETVRNHTGIILEVQRYEATITVQIQQPTNVESILNNPVGVYITAISTSKLLEN